MQIQDAQVIRIVQLLRCAQVMPGMYLGGTDPHVLGAFLFVMDFMPHILDVQTVDLKPFLRALFIERGWTQQRSSDSAEMRERGLADAEITTEFLTIRIEAWKRAYPHIDWEALPVPWEEALSNTDGEAHS